MAITGDFVNGLHLMVGLSTDTKPDTTSENTFFLCEDTGDVYYFSEGEWAEADAAVAGIVAALLNKSALPAVTATDNGKVLKVVDGVWAPGTGGGGGISDDAKEAIVNAFAHVAWEDDSGADCYNAVVASLYNVSSISATFTQSGTIYDNATLESLKASLVVTATYSGGTTETLDAANYTLSGTLEAGTSTITVTYGDKTDTFDVTVSSSVLYSLTNQAFNKEKIDTGVKVLETDRDFTIAMDMTISSVPSSGDGSATKLVTLVNGAGTGMAVQISKTSGQDTVYATWQTTNTDPMSNYGAGRVRFVITHVAGSGTLYVKTRYASENPVAETISAAYVATSNTVRFGGNGATQYLPVGTITKAQILAYAMSEAEVNQWCGQ